MIGDLLIPLVFTRFVLFNLFIFQSLEANYNFGTLTHATIVVSEFAIGAFQLLDGNHRAIACICFQMLKNKLTFEQAVKMAIIDCKCLSPLL